MLKRLALTILSIIGGTFVLAAIIFSTTSANSLHDYASISMWCSIGTAGIGACIISGSIGPRRSGDAHYMQAMVHQSHPDLEKLDRKDRESGPSLGFLMFASGVFCIIISYGLFSI